MKSHFIDKRRRRVDTPSMTANNKLIVERALTALIGSGNARALEPFLHDNFLHHRPDATSSKAEWLAAVQAVPLADLRVEVRHLLADGAHVVMHSKRWLAAGGPEIVGVDIWRLEDGLIVEGWEILERSADAAGHMVWWKSTP